MSRLSERIAASALLELSQRVPAPPPDHLPPLPLPPLPPGMAWVDPKACRIVGGRPGALPPQPVLLRVSRSAPRASP